MKKLFSITAALFLYICVGYANGDNFHNAVSFYAQSKYEKAKELFVLCQSSGDFDSVNISIWIKRCDNGIQEQRQNAQAAAVKYRRKLDEREKNKYVYLSVNATESGALFSGIESSLSEVMRRNGRTFHHDINESYTIVTVNTDLKETIRDNHYIVDLTGTIRLGSAIDPKQFYGQWTVGPCKGESVESFDDAKRIALIKINKELSTALDNLFNGKAQNDSSSSLDNSIAVYLGSGNNVGDEPLSDFLNAIYYYIDQNPEYQRNATIDPSVVKDIEAEYQRQGKMTRREERSEIGEQKGIRYMLRLSVEKRADNSYFFAGNIFDLNSGYSIATAPDPKYKFNINSLNRDSQELAAAILSVGLGLKQWEIGEEIGGYKLALCNGLHGTLLKIEDVEPYKKCEITEYRNAMIYDGVSADEAALWRFPYADELLEMIPHKKELNIRNIYWTEDKPSKGKHIAVDFRTGKEIELKDSDKKTAAVVLVKDF